MSQWCCYLIKSKSYPNHTYIGSTNNINKRIKQHNKQLCGGAKATRKHKDWELVKSVPRGTKSEALSFEYYWKHYKSSSGRWYNTLPGINNKLKRLQDII